MLLGDLRVALGPGVGVGDQLGADGLKKMDELGFALLATAPGLDVLAQGAYFLASFPRSSALVRVPTDNCQVASLLVKDAVGHAIRIWMTLSTGHVLSPIQLGQPILRRGPRVERLAMFLGSGSRVWRRPGSANPQLTEACEMDILVLEGGFDERANGSPRNQGENTPTD